MLDEKTARRLAERELVRELFSLNIPLEKKIEILVKETAEGPLWTEFKSQQK